MKLAVLVTFALAVVGAMSPAQANTVVCDGTVTSISYHNPGIVMLKLSSMNLPVMACNLDGNWTIQGVTTPHQTCKALFAAMMAAQMSRTPISHMWFDGESMPTSCTGFQPHTHVSVRYYDF